MAVGTVVLMASWLVGPLRPTDLVGGEPPSSGLRARLEAGEFGPAIQMALGADTERQRDVQLQQICLAQIAAGARDASLQTAYDIRDDRLRDATYTRIRSSFADGASLRGGGPQADFDSLIELITTTIDPDTWEDVGGEGAIHEFAGGVFVDGSGVLRQVETEPSESWLNDVRRSSMSSTPHRDVRRPSKLRKVSLPRLEKCIQMRWAQGQAPTEVMRVLAGLCRIEYVLVYPEQRDIVIAGPAGDWYFDPLGRAINVEEEVPTLALDDLVVLLRNGLDGDGRFGCSITPRRENLEQARSFLDASAKRPLKPSQRAQWLGQLRDHLGHQDIEVYGIDRRTRTARVIVEADHHMKLIGMGLAEGVPGVQSYLESVRLAAGQAPPPLGLLRWWFTLNYKAIRATEDREAFQLQGPGVKVQSENELLSERGERVHTGKSELRNREFAASFTRHFDALAHKYPVYAELRNVFDLALVAALIRSEDLVVRAGWSAAHFRNPQAYQVALAPAPEQVDTVVNHRVLNRKYIVAGVSGGVSVDPRIVLDQAGIVTAPYSELNSHQAEGAASRDLPRDRWWWD